MLFFAGTRDSLCDLEQLRGVLKKMKPKWDLEVIDGGDHSFNLPKTVANDFQGVAESIAKKSLSWISL